MTEKLKTLIRLLAYNLDFPEPITEFGALQVRGQEGFADLRPLFPGKLYVGVDMRPGPGVDVVLDVTATGYKDGLAGSILCLDMLEHCRDDRLAISEMHRILHPDGMLVLSIPFAHPIHDHPSDYRRLTQEGLRVLLEAFAHVETGQSEEGVNPASVIAVAWKTPPAPEVANRVRAFLACWPGVVAPRRKTLRSRVRDLVPVGLLNLYRVRHGERAI